MLPLNLLFGVWEFGFLSVMFLAVIIIEAGYLSRRLFGKRLDIYTMAVVTISNILSTAIGVSSSRFWEWVGNTLIEKLDCPGYCDFLPFMIVAFLLTVLIETPVNILLLIWPWPSPNPKNIARHTFMANIWSYAFLLIVSVAIVIYGKIKYP